MHKQNTTRGFTLVEAIVAISIMVFALVGPLSLALNSLRAYRITERQLTGVALAAEGIELIRHVRDNNSAHGKQWLEGMLTSGGGAHCETGCIVDATETDYTNIIKRCNPPGCATDDIRLYTDGSQFYRQSIPTPSGAWSPTQFSRLITIEVIDPDKEIRVISTVTWTGGSRQLISEVYNWFPDFTKLSS